MTTTFPPSEVSVRRSLVTFQVMEGISIVIIMVLLVISLSMGYAICTRRTDLEMEQKRLMNRSGASGTFVSNDQLYMQRISNL